MEPNDTSASKNLHASVPAALLARAEAIAEQEQISLDELAAEALLQHVARRALERFRQEAETRRSGLSEEQIESIVDCAIHDHRQERAH